MKQYFPLFRIALRHNFYPGEIGKGLVLTPAPTTIPLMRRYDLHWRSDGHEYRIFYGTESGSTPALAYVEKPFGLRFVLRSEHPYFFNITALPFPQNALEKLYFHNLRPHPADGQPLSLSNGAKASGDDFLTRDIGLRPADLGVVDIYIGRAADTMILPPAADSAAPPERLYHLSFEARKTHWRYYVVNLPDPERAELEVITDCKKIDKSQGNRLSGKPATCKIFGELPGDKPLDCKLSETGADNKPADCTLFEKGESRVLSGVGQTAVSLFSKHAFPMQEQPFLKVKLKVNKEGNGLPVDLPTPDWRRISQGPNQQVFSDMYVYL